MSDDERFRREYLCQFVPQDRGRNSGRTTAIALRLIAAAVECNGTSVNARDHDEGPSGQVNLRNVVQDIVKSLNLDIETRLIYHSYRAVEARSNRGKRK